MCVFQSSEPVHTTSTNIALYADQSGRHHVIYQNSVTSYGSAAMILPIPTTDAASVELIDESSRPTLFADIESTYFPIQTTRGGYESMGVTDMLEVHSVGAYSASVAPDVHSILTRLDIEVFGEMEDDLLTLLKKYEDQGYAFVVALVTSESMEPHALHIAYLPLDPALAYVPLRHYHDDTVGYQEMEEFDHTIYAKTIHRYEGWEDGTTYTDVYPFSSRDGAGPGEVKKLVMRGMFSNEDEFLPVDDIEW